MLATKHVPLRRSRSRCVRRICDIVHLTREGPNPTSAELDRMDTERHDRREVTRYLRDEERKEAAAIDDMKRRLLAMGMVVRKDRKVA